MELLVVLSIIGLIVATSVPAFGRYLQQVRLNSATRQTVRLLSLARQSAIAAREPRTILVDPAEKTLVIEESLDEEQPRHIQLPPAIDIAVETPDQSQPPWRLIFQPSGALAGRSASVTLSNETRGHTIAVTAATGAISVQ